MTYDKRFVKEVQKLVATMDAPDEEPSDDTTTPDAPDTTGNGLRAEARRSFGVKRGTAR